MLQTKENLSLTSLTGVSLLFFQLNCASQYVAFSVVHQTETTIWQNITF